MVKRKGNLMPRLCTMTNIILADINARKLKARSRKYINKHDENLLNENTEILNSFCGGSFKTSRYTRFTIYEPKERIIFRLPYFPDRIAQHAIMNVVKDYWKGQFITNTYSCIEGRGIHKCLKDLRRVLRKTRFTDETKYCLKLDVRKFYPSVDHTVMKEILNRKIKDKRFLNILYEIIDSVNGIDNIYGRGLPIGNYLSQYLANLYLSPLDHWLKEEVKVKHYFRYADDIVILSGNKEELKVILTLIKLYLNSVLKLEVKQNYQIFPVEIRGIDFIGYVFKHDFIKVRKSIKLKCKRKILTNNMQRLTKIIPSYYGWFCHCNSVNLINTINNLLILKSYG